MLNPLLYLGTVLIWGSTWLAIQYQVDSANPVWSVAYRFALATLILFAFCFYKKISLHFNKKAHLAIFIQSALMFSLNYIFYYLGSAHLISGYVAVVGATLALINIINARIFLKTPFNKPTLIGAFTGIAGLIVVFWQEFASINSQSGQVTVLVLAIGCCLLGTYIASVGNILSKKMQELKLPILQTNAWGMLYGTLITTVVALCFHLPMQVHFSAQFFISLLYLSLFGSVIAFGMYLKLIGTIGPERAGYSFVLTPIVAIILSTFFEGFHWQLSTIVGIVMILGGNALVMTAPKLTATK